MSPLSQAQGKRAKVSRQHGGNVLPSHRVSGSATSRALRQQACGQGGLTRTCRTCLTWRAARHHTPSLPAAAREITTPPMSRGMGGIAAGPPTQGLYGLHSVGICQGFRISFDGSKGQAKSAAWNMASTLARWTPTCSRLHCTGERGGR